MSVRVKHYFVADVHLGLKLPELYAREEAFVDWLDSIAHDAAALYLLGDIFDFWWEYKHVVPKGYVRVLGRLAQLADSGIAIHFFKGNHDQWTFGYLEKEIEMQLHDEPFVAQIGNRRFCLGHGDSLCVAGRKKKVLRKMFASRFLQKCFGAIHPRWGVSLGHWWSARHRVKNMKSGSCEAEVASLVQFASTFSHPVDYFVFGHLHTPVDTTIANKARLLILSEWMPCMQYALFDALDGTFFVHSHSLNR
ncbi:MAG: UDP-2,3-diacylglucosamine diphosphatase [Bacteroidales bacterium]|nr:UDP-2,3-diacylglucosamine diphosphatase [Bacteroidales bacterium]